MFKRVLSSMAFLFVFIGLILIPTVTAKSEAPSDGVDFMVICAHPGDEYLFLGGALALYAGEQGRSAVVVYLSESSGVEQTAAQDALARFGGNVKAVFGSFSSAYASSEEEQLRYWDSREVITYLVGVIRQYQPAIVLTHHPLGEYGNGAHIVTSSSTYKAVLYAPEFNRYPESAALFGSWQVRRLFFHQYGDDIVTLDRSQPLDRFNGLSALMLDQQGYAFYPNPYPIKICEESGYTNAQYGLALVSDETEFDPMRGDLFAGMDASILGPTASPYSSPTPSPTPEVVAAAVKQDTAVAEAPEHKEPVQTSTEKNSPNTIILIFGGILGAVTLLGALLLKKGVGLKTTAIIAGSVIIIAMVICVQSYIQLKQTSFPSHKAQALTADAPTLAPTASAEMISEPLTTPMPDPWDAFFRCETDPAEVLINDPVNEHWEYRSDSLSVIIDRIHITKPDSKPIAYCIAHIRMRNEDAFQAGVRNDNPKAIPSLEHAWHMARRYRAVLGITGDNLIQAEVAQKGILMRNGIVFSQNQAQDILAFYPNDLTIKVFKPKTITVEELKAQGVSNTFSFGPTMLNNGVRDLSSRRSRLGKTNPRSGLGMVEPGHFIAITVDGRQKNYSVGMSIEEFTQLFYLNGCQIAYNLDGGASAAMIFMGECLNQHSGIDSDVQRPWTDGLFWGFSELVPSVDDPVYNDGSKPWVMPPA
jgi:hypothetical protein